MEGFLWCRYVEEAVIEARTPVKLCVLEGGLNWSWRGRTAVAFGLQGGPGGITSESFRISWRRGRLYSFSSSKGLFL